MFGMVKKAAVAFGDVCLISPALCRSILRRRNERPVGRAAWKNPIGSALMYAVLERYYDPRTSTQERERLKSLRMSGRNGVEWARHYARKGFPDEQTARLPIWRWLEDLLGDGSVEHVHQIACSSGREIAHYARACPHKTFVGSDMESDVVAYARRAWAGIDNLRFVTLHLLDTSAFEDCLGADLIVDSGGLQYLDQASLQTFFDRAHVLAPRICLCEAVRTGWQSGQSTRKGNFSWNHDYPALLERAGYTVVRTEVVELPEMPWSRTVCVMAARP